MRKNILKPVAEDVDYRVVGILGTDHSCSTLLGCMLGAADQPGRVFHTGECHAFFRPKTFRHGPRCVIEKECPIWMDIDPSDKGKTAYQQIANRTRCPVIVDSSKTVKGWFDAQHKIMKKQGRDIRYIVVWKLPVDLAYSYWKRVNGLAPVCHEMVCTQMKRLKQVVAFEKKAKSEFLVVRADRLVSSPARILEKICDYCDIPFFPGKEKYWKYEHHHLYGSNLQRRHIRNPETAGFIQHERDPGFPADVFSSLDKKYSDLVQELDARSLSL